MGAATAAFCDLGRCDYPAVHALQVALAAGRRAGTLADDVLLCVEHPPVFTLGRRGNREHLGVGESFLRERNIAVVPIERGGEITYHGPGQLVLYPILDLRKARLGVGDYVYLLEELMLRLASDFGVQAGRDARNRGVWVGNNKLGSIGIAIRHGIAFHGMALNIDLDLEPFAWINPCGLRDVGMTSLLREGATACTMDRVKARLQHYLTEVFGMELYTLSPVNLTVDFPSSAPHP